jgi:hypothetical protein
MCIYSFSLRGEVAGQNFGVSFFFLKESEFI